MKMKIYELHEKTMICPLHGGYTFNPLVYNGSVIYAGCPECVKIREEKESAGTRPEYDRLKDMNIGLAYLETCFDNFDACNGSLQTHLKTAANFARNPCGKLVMLGSNGTGKTHLAVSVLKQTGGVIYTAFEIGAMLRRSYNGDSKEWEMLKELCEVKLLVIDEIGRTKGSDWELNWLSHVINKRHENHRPLILISNRHLEYDCPLDGKDCKHCLENYFDNDVISRIIEDGLVMKFDSEDYRYKKRERNNERRLPEKLSEGGETMKTERELLDFKMRLLQAEIDMQGMIAENKQRTIQGESMAYRHDDFMSLIAEYRIGHNDLWGEQK